MVSGGAAVQAGAAVSWTVDADGNGSVNGDDRRLIEESLGAARGFGLVPNPGYDFRADLLARGRVSADDLAFFDALAAPGPALPRPLVMCWHYGWYHPQRRRNEQPTARFLGGDYNSDDPAVEGTFNALKNEFGITADLLSWIAEPSPGRTDTLQNYELGYFAAPLAETRSFGWLYETVINLGSDRPMTMGPETGRPQALEQHFRHMARKMVDPGSGAAAPKVLLLDGRPVVYMFASHVLGTDSASFPEVGVALDRARAAFIEEAGVAPFLIGDEALFLADGGNPDAGRRFRAPFFDAITRYHHYELSLVSGPTALEGEVHLAGTYVDRVVANERRTAEVFAGVRNRYNAAPVFTMPSSAAGFAKAGLPTVRATRDEYAAFLRTMLALTEDNLRSLAELVVGAVAGKDRGVIAMPPQVTPVIVGSWNEEFEGHTVFPTRSNPAMVRSEFAGFEWLMAIKEVYGWNHPVVARGFAGRPLAAATARPAAPDGSASP